MTVRDFKRIKFAEIDLSNSLTIIGGKNAQGKSSAIDALVSAIGGKTYAPSMPIRKGAEKAETIVKIDTPRGVLTVRRYFTAAGSAVEVRNEEGMKPTAPQALLDSLMSTVALDPLAFTRKDPKKQVEDLKRMVGLDFSELDRKAAALTDARKIANAKVKELEAKFRDMPPIPEGTRDEEVSLSALSEELERAYLHNAERDRLDAEADRQNERLRTADLWISQAESKVIELRNQLAEAEVTLARYQAGRGPIEAEAQAAAAAVAAFELKDTDALRAAIASGEMINRSVRQMRKVQAAREEWRAAAQQAEALTAELAAIDEEKRKQLGAAKFPVDGLTFDETGLFLNGIPFAQASSAEQLRVSVPLAFSEAPNLKFAIIKDGSLLDHDSLALVAELTDKAGGQLILERVGSDDMCSIVMTEGVVEGQQPELEVA